MIPLYGQFDYISATQLYPVSKKIQKNGFAALDGDFISCCSTYLHVVQPCSFVNRWKFDHTCVTFNRN
jgi:predicted ABC-type exoprotein transport system permease subunit